jgi:hypothetical protein
VGIILVISIINPSTQCKLLMLRDSLDMTLTMQAESAPRKAIGRTPLPLLEEEEEVEGALALATVGVPLQANPLASTRPIMPTRWMKS